MAGGLERGGDAALSLVELMMRYLDSLPQEFSFREEVRSSKFWKALRAEFLATLLLVIFVSGCSSLSSTASPSSSGGHVNGTIADNGSSTFRLALAYCLTTATLVQCFGNVSGAQTNPAVTVGLLVTRRISPLRAAGYVTVQTVGALGGALIVFGLTPRDWPQKQQVLTVGDGVALTQAFGMEFLATFLAVVTTLAALDPAREDVGCKALSIGLAYGVGTLFSFQMTGACLNPVRALGPAVVNNVWTNHWVYWVGPVFGGILGGFTYEFVHDSSPHGRYLHRSFRRRPPDLTRSDPAARGRLRREVSGISTATTDVLQPAGAEISGVSRH